VPAAACAAGGAEHHHGVLVSHANDRSFAPHTLPGSGYRRGVTTSETPADIHFYFDPVCPFAWMTSKWVRQVQAQRDYTVDWRFISLRLLNAHLDYDAHFPVGYEDGHTAGLRLLRVASAVREQHGREAVGRFYEAVSGKIFDLPPEQTEDGAGRGRPEFVRPVLEALGLPATLADALEDTARDAEIQAETDEALSLTGKDVGTPILHFQPPTGVAFFGPVISRLPSDAEAAQLWDHVVGLASFPGFAELKRSLRELPQLRALGVSEEEAGTTEDWHGGSRRQAADRG
jgi:2-hydroxychromene-2-carboxylate isomerase